MLNKLRVDGPAGKLAISEDRKVYLFVEESVAAVGATSKPGVPKC